MRFGMTQAEVRETLGQEPTWIDCPNIGETKLEEHYDDFVGVHYDETDRVYSLVFAPGTVVLRFNGVELIGPRAVPNPLLVLYTADPSPFEDVGFVVFDKIGVAATGYHDEQEDQRAITLMQTGTWNTAHRRPLTLEDLEGPGG